MPTADLLHKIKQPPHVIKDKQNNMCVGLFLAEYQNCFLSIAKPYKSVWLLQVCFVDCTDMDGDW